MKDIILESKDQVYIIQYDLAAAYDTMSRNYAYACLKEMGVPELHITLIKNLIEDNEANITKENRTIGKIKLETGIGQGDANSNVIFNIGNILIATVLSNIKGIKNISLKRIDNKKNTITESKIKTKPVIFANDGLVTVGKIEDIKTVLDKLEKFSSISGMKISNDKLKI